MSRQGISGPVHVFRLPRSVQIGVVIVFLYVARPRDGRGDSASHFDLKTLHYRERDGRIRVVSPTFLYRHAASPDLSFKIEGIFNTISGATPTGAPPAFLPVEVPEPICIPVVVSVPSSSGGGGYDDDDEEDEHDEEDEEDEEDEAEDRRAERWHARAGATPSSGGGGGGSSSSGGSSTTTVCQPVDPPPPPDPVRGTELPLAEVEDTRWGLSLEVSKRVGRQTFVGQVAYSTEDDYDSFGVAFSDAIALNQRNTTLLLGAGYTYDIITVPNLVDDTKQTFDLMVGLTQVLSPKTMATLNLTHSRSQGYLSDPYKVVELNRILVPELRPDDKDKFTVYVSLVRYIEWLQASGELSYRWHQDSNGIEAHTAGLAWYQRMGKHLILRPRVRFYDQNAADFYGYFFDGSPEFYSSDYRVSAMQAVGYGIKLIWNPTKNLSLDVGYDRYDQQGKDETLPEEMYPSADFITGGLRIWL